MFGNDGKETCEVHRTRRHEKSQGTWTETSREKERGRQATWSGTMGCRDHTVSLDSMHPPRDDWFKGVVQMRPVATDNDDDDDGKAHRYRSTKRKGEG